MLDNEQSTAVIVGRFQTPALHEGHKNLIDEVISNHKRVIIFLGISNQNSKRNPLDFFTRKVMIESEYPNVIVQSIPDMRDDKDWSNNLDSRIDEIVKHESVVLYGSRDSFIPYYKGKFQTKEIGANVYTSATELRNSIKNETRSSEDFRAGVIYGSFHKYDISYQTVDVAIIKNFEILMARKPHEKEYRFIGGFVDPEDKCFADAVRREVKEETGLWLEIADIKYLTSERIDDWRYRSEYDKIMTAFFTAKYVFGAMKPDDDIAELKFFHIDMITAEDVVAEHRVLLKDLMIHKDEIFGKV